MGSRWAFVVATRQGTALGELTAARGRRLSFRLDAPAEASCSLSGRDDQALLIDELRTDLIAYREGVRVFRGRIGPSADDLDPDGHTLGITAHDYRAMLDRRVLYAGDTRDFLGVDQEAIGWSLIAATQARTAGDLGITRGASQSTGVLRDRSYETGKGVGEALAELGRVSNGFEWAIDADLVYRVFSPQRGTTRAVVLAYPGNLRSVRRTLATNGFTNAGRVSGAEGVAAVEWEVAGLASSLEGRFDSQIGYTDVTEPATLAAKANYHSVEGSARRASYAVTFQAGGWGGPEELWVGDTVQLVVKSGRLRSSIVQRVVQIDIDAGDDGPENVTVTLGRTPADGVQRAVDTERRLRQLERN